MWLILVILLVILLLGGLGLFLVKLLFWLAIVLFLLWIIGFFFRGAEGSRWYRW